MAIIEGTELHLEACALDIRLHRSANVWMARERSGEFEVYADLMNHPGLRVELNGRRFELDPGMSKSLAVSGLRA